MKTKIAGIVVVLATFAGSAVAAGVPTVDAVQAANMVHQIGEIQKQVMLAQQQLAQVQATYRAVSGNRGFGALLTNPMVRQALPPDLQSLYYRANSGSYAGITGPLERILRSEALASDVPTAQRNIIEREMHVKATNKAVAEYAYAATQKRLDEIQMLQAEIQRTQDPKGIAELQARLAVVQSDIGNESMKLALVQQMQASELELADEQRKVLSTKFFGPDVRGEPSILD